MKRLVAILCLFHAGYFLFGISEPASFWQCCPSDSSTVLNFHPDLTAGVIAALELIAAGLVASGRKVGAVVALAIAAAMGITLEDAFAWMPALILVAPVPFMAGREPTSDDR